MNLTIHTVCHICILMHHLKGASFLYILKRCLFVLFTIWMQNKILAVMMETIKFFTFSFVCSLLQEIATRWVFELEAISLVWRCLQAMTICSSPKFKSACQCVEPLLHEHWVNPPMLNDESTLNSFRVEGEPFRSVNEKCHPNLGTAELSHNVSCPAHFLTSAVNIAHENRILTPFYNSV